MLQKLLSCNQRDEWSAYQLFLYSADSFQKELSVKLWQQFVQHVAELQVTVKRYGGDLPADAQKLPSTAGSAGASPIAFHDHVRRALDEGGETVSAYEDALKRDWTIDIRMLLQRQHLRCKDILHRLEDAFLPAPHAA